MAFGASLRVRCWKLHRCVACGCAFRYQLARKVSAHAATRETALDRLESKIQETMLNEVDDVPCPRCGVLQPKMVARRRNRTARWAGLGVGLILVALALAWQRVLTIGGSSWLAVLGASLAAVVLLIAVRRDPNRHPHNNRVKALPRLRRGLIEVTEIDDGSAAIVDVDYRGTAPRPTGWLVVAAATLAVGAVMSPLLLQTLLRWPVNQHWYPGVVGPGDTSRFYMQSTLESLKGLWNGAVVAHIIEPPWLDAAAPRPSAKTMKSSWGDQITGQSLSNSTRRIWIDIELPGDQRLADQDLELFLDVAVHYPLKLGEGFQDDLRELQETAALATAKGYRPGRLYWRSWLVGQSTGALVLLLAIWAVGRMNRELAREAGQGELMPIEIS